MKVLAVSLTILALHSANLPNADSIQPSPTSPRNPTVGPILHLSTLSDVRDNVNSTNSNAKTLSLFGVQKKPTSSVFLVDDNLVAHRPHLQDSALQPATAEERMPSGVAIPDGVIATPITYSEIQEMIDVTRPYYILKDEHILHDPKTGTTAGFVCKVDAEMPLGREAGAMAGAEAGRHMAIAGSVAAALENAKEGKHYYLALDVEFEQVPVDAHEFKKPGEITGSFSTSNENNPKAASTKIYARCLEMNKRKAKCEIVLEDETTGQRVKQIVTYAVVTPRMFNKMNSPPRPIDGAETPVLGAGESPYKSFSCDLPVRKVGPGTYETVLPPVPAHMCAGHFDGNPALPIAILCSYICDLVAETISGLTNVPIRKLSTRPEGTISSEQHATGNSLVFGEAQVKTSKLIQADHPDKSTHIKITCVAMFRDGGGLGKHASDYEAVVKVHELTGDDTSSTSSPPICVYSAVATLNLGDNDDKKEAETVTP